MCIKRMRGFKRLDNRMRFLHLALALDERVQREDYRGPCPSPLLVTAF